MFSSSRFTLNRRVFIGMGAAAGITTALPFRSYAAHATKVSLALDWYPNANHAGIYMAEANGYFADAGLEVDIVVPADPTTVLQTVGAGRDSFGVTYQSDILQARAQGVPVQSVAAMVQHPLNSIMVLASSDIHTPADLAGKTIAMAGVPADEAMLQTILADSGLTLDDVHTVNVGFDLLPALFSERADAIIGVYWTHETILAEHEGYEVRYLRVEEWGVPDYYELLIVGGERLIGDQPEVVSAFLGALRQGYEDAAADPDAALALLIEQNPELVEDVEREGLELLAPLWTDDGDVYWGTQTADRWDAYAAWSQEQGLLGDDVAAADAWIDLFSED